MNYTEQDLEKTLRSAPQPAAPRALQQQLIEQIRAGGGTHQLSAQTKLSKAWRRNNRWRWLQRWWPALGPAALSLACAAVLTSQQFEIRGLKQQLQAASGHVTENGRAATAVAPTPRDSAASTETAPVDEEAEIQRLKALTVTLSQEITRLQQMKGENENLRRQLAASSFANLTPEEKDDLQKVKENAERINCINNLKQIGLAMRTWGLDNDDAYPPNFQVMSNELSTPKILKCPSDTARTAAPDFISFSSANCSYEYFAPAEGDKPINEPTRVMVRCPIHGSIGLADGSVQSEVAKKHPEWLIQHGGKLYFQAVSSQPPNQKQ